MALNEGGRPVSHVEGRRIVRTPLERDSGRHSVSVCVYGQVQPVRRNGYCLYCIWYCVYLDNKHSPILTILPLHLGAELFASSPVQGQLVADWLRDWRVPDTKAGPIHSLISLRGGRVLCVCVCVRRLGVVMDTDTHTDVDTQGVLIS